MERNLDAFFEQLIRDHHPPYKSMNYVKVDEKVLQIGSSFSQQRSEYLNEFA